MRQRSPAEQHGIELLQAPPVVAQDDSHNPAVHTQPEVQALFGQQGWPAPPQRLQLPLKQTSPEQQSPVEVQAFPVVTHADWQTPLAQTLPDPQLGAVGQQD